MTKVISNPEVDSYVEHLKIVHDLLPTQTDMSYMNETAELRPRFSVLSAIGIQYSITATPLAIGGYVTFILGVGGSPYFFYCYLVAAIGQLLVCVSLSEIAAFHPHVSGQVFWTAALSPPGWTRIFSYWNGASSCLGWIFANVGTFVFTAKIILGAMMQVYLVAIGSASVGLLFNTFLFNFYPRITKFMVYFINLSTVYIFVALLVRATPKATAHHVFVEVVNKTGWSSNGLVFVLGFLPGSVAVSCFDAAAHMAEEMDHPERQVPQVMIGATVLCAVSALPMILTYLFCTTNPIALLTPIGGQRVFQILLDGLRSEGLLVTALVIFIIVYMSSGLATIATGSRLIWSFAKHGGLPCATWLSFVHPTKMVPVNAVYLVTAVSCVLALLAMGPSTVLNGVFGAGGVCFFISYGLPIWLMIFGGRKKLPKQRYFNLGKFGIVVNIASICWQLLSVVCLSFPLFRPVTATNMNWASVCSIVGLAIFGVNWAFCARQYYKQPKPLLTWQRSVHGTNTM